MPEQELPEEFIKPIGSPSNSSLSSNSSDIILINAQYISPRSASISSGSTNAQDSFEAHHNIRNVLNSERGDEVDDDEEQTYQPIKLPTEPTLEELLKQVVGRGDIRQVEQVKLRIISSAISLQRLPYFMPHLRCLNLEGSMLFSLRDLGCDLMSLVYLNISRCGLRSLDGTNGLTTLTELVADYNQIEDAGACSNLPQIQKISLISNKIKDFHGIMFLGLCNQLRVLDISNNVVTTKDNYRHIVKSNISQLSILDQVPFEEMSDELKLELTRSEYHTNIASSDINRLLSSNARPSTATSTPIAHISIGKRPITAEGKKLKHDVSVGEPVCGSIIAKARSLRKMRTAWGESFSSSSSTYGSSDSSSQSTPASSAKLRTIQSNQECEELLESAKAWREKSRETREKYSN